MRIEFLLTSLVVAIAPGTGVLFTLSAGLTRGRRAAAVAAFGCTLGILPHLAAAMTGLAALLHQSALAFQSVKYAGVAYLLFLAWRMLRDNGRLEVPGDVAERSVVSTIGTAILLNLLNPKLSIFFLAFLPQFMDAADPAPLATMAAMGGAFMAITLAVFLLYGGFAAALREQVVARPAVLRWMRRVFAGAFVLLGARLAVAER